MNLHHLSKPLTLGAIFILLLSAITMVLSDLYSPFTTDSYVSKRVSKISPEVNGVVERVYVKNGQFVKKGSRLFSIDASELKAKYNTAYANLIILKQNLDKLRLESELIINEIQQKTEVLQNKQKHYLRMKALLTQKAVNQEQFDDAYTDYLDSKREVEQLRIELDIKQVKIGSEEGENGGLMLGEALLNKAKLNLKKATVYAPFSGVITNMQLVPGQYTSPSSPQIVLTSLEEVYLVANFNEKGLKRLGSANCLVVFDSIPGRVFKTSVSSIDPAVTVTGFGTTELGDTANVTQGDRWIRQSQYIRSTLLMPTVEQELISGSRATVMVVREDNLYWNYFTHLVMNIMSWFRYIY